MSVENILSVRNITKTYPGVIALQNISMDFKKGEIHALVGENGAGKSTLIKVIAGAVSVDKGHVYFEGELQEIQEPLERRKLGICITKISTFLILCDLAVCLATLYVSFSLVFALMRYLQGKVFLIRFYSPTTLSSSRAEFRLPSRLACA